MKLLVSCCLAYFVLFETPNVKNLIAGKIKDASINTNKCYVNLISANPLEKRICASYIRAILRKKTVGIIQIPIFSNDLVFLESLVYLNYIPI